MPRPSQLTEKRRLLAPAVAKAFADLGYRRTTTAELASRCRVQENILYRLWRDKKAMFIAAIDYIYESSAQTWAELLKGKPSEAAAEILLAYEATHFAENGYARIIFAGLSETDDPEIRKALAQMYQRYQAFVLEQLQKHRGSRNGKLKGDIGLAAWGFVGLGTVAAIVRELKLLSDKERGRLMTQVGRLLLEGA